MDHQQPLPGRDRLGDGVGEPLGQRLGGLDVHQVLAEDHELIAAIAGDRVAVADLTAQACRDADEQLVADLVAVDVVDLLEAVEVDEQDTDRGALAAKSRERRGQAVHQQVTIGQAGQRVVHRPVLELATGAELASRVAEADHHGAIAARKRAGRYRERTAVAQRDLKLLSAARKLRVGGRLGERFLQPGLELLRLGDDPLDLADERCEVMLAAAARRRRQHRGELVVPERHRARAIEHRHAVGHGVEDPAQQRRIRLQGVA